MDDWWETLADLVAELEAAHITCCVVDAAALFAQGVAMPAPPLTIAVQWDQFAPAQARVAPLATVGRDGRWERFGFERAGWPVIIACQRNTVVAADPDRTPVERGGRSVPCKTLLAIRQGLPPVDPLIAAIDDRLRAWQRELNRINAAAWERDAYAATVERHGPPSELAAAILADPAARLSALQRWLPASWSGERVINLLGSYGGKALALAALGAAVTLVDIAPANIRYADELAAAAGLPLHTLAADVLDLPTDLLGGYDWALMELGILHYFVDLAPLAGVVAALLRPGGRLLIQDFHPLSTKLISSRGRKHTVSGNYFDPALRAVPVAYSKHLAGAAAPQVLQRRWTLGEAVSAFAAAGLRVLSLSEDPNTKLDDIGLPKTWTLLAERS